MRWCRVPTVNVLFAVCRLAFSSVVENQEGTMRSASDSKPKIASCEEARRGEAVATLAMMLV